MGNNELNEFATSKINTETLKADCENCFGLCCVALYFSASDGFPLDKAGGQPCLNLQENFRCRVHKDLDDLGLKGCRAYDCFGAGQKVSQNTFNKISWRQSKESSAKMFDCYLIMCQLHELLWYLAQAAGQKAASSIRDKLISLFEVTKNIANSEPEAIIQLDITAQRQKVNLMLLQTSELVRREVFAQMKDSVNNNITGSDKDLTGAHKMGSDNDLTGERIIGPGKDLIGADLRKVDLRGASLRGSYLIAADLRGCSLQGVDLIGADLRDADIRCADLSKSIFLTQAQLNAARGNNDTKFPNYLFRPVYWKL